MNLNLSGMDSANAVGPANAGDPPLVVTCCPMAVILLFADEELGANTSEEPKAILQLLEGEEDAIDESIVDFRCCAEGGPCDEVEPSE